MNEKTPNVQTQAAMTRAREMARNRMLELVVLTDGVESFPNFTNPARQRLLSNVWCGQCRHETTITNVTGIFKGADLLLVGKRAECQGDVTRVIEGS